MLQNNDSDLRLGSPESVLKLALQRLHYLKFNLHVKSKNHKNTELRKSNRKVHNHMAKSNNKTHQKQWTRTVIFLTWYRHFQM